MGFLYYIFWSNITLSTFYLLYVLLFKRETFFLWNRVYLLSILCFSAVIPFFDLSTLIKIPKIELAVSTFSAVGTEKLAVAYQEDLNWISIFYWIGVCISFILLLLKLVGIKRHMKQPITGMAFSFWKTKVIDQKLSGIDAIDAHETIHIKQFHTLDIILVEVVGIFFWFNPLIYCYQRSLKLIHEYLADEYAVSFTESKKQYAMVLFLQNFKAGPALVNTFYNVSLLELRIKMLQRKKSKRYNLWKYSLCIPLMVVFTFLCSFSTTNFNQDHYSKLDKTASFPGGFQFFSEYVIKTARNVSSQNGRVKVSFIVETNGLITNEKIEIGLDKASNREALRIVKSSPKWEPAIQNGEKVRSAYDLNINF